MRKHGVEVTRAFLSVVSRQKLSRVSVTMRDLEMIQCFEIQAHILHDSITTYEVLKTPLTFLEEADLLPPPIISILPSFYISPFSVRYKINDDTRYTASTTP